MNLRLTKAPGIASPRHVRSTPASPGSNPRFTTKTFLQTILAVAISVLVPVVAHATSATWDLNPGSGDWNAAANWTPMGVPNGPADVATFGLSNTTDVSISANTEVNSIIFRPTATNTYTITATSALKLTISGVGVVNNSGIAQNFVAASSPGFANALRLVFKNSATAGSETFFTMNGGAAADESPGVTVFEDSSSAGHGTFTNNGPTTLGTSGGGITEFTDNATASNGTFVNNGGTIHDPITSDQGATVFIGNSSAGNGVFTNNAGTVSGARGGQTGFSANATAANGTFINNGSLISGQGNGFNSGSGMTLFSSTSLAGNATFTNNAATVTGSGGGFVQFRDASTAGDGMFINNGATVTGAGGGSIYFYDTATAGNATLIANGGLNGGGGGTIFFADQSTAGTAQIEVFGNGSLDISFHRTPGIAINSVEGDGNVFLGGNNLTVGSDNLNTTFACAIQDGGQGGGVGGSLTKVGTATLELTGANTYTGNTNVNRGVLQVDGSITSNTFVHDRGTLAGTGMIHGNVTNNDFGTARPGGALGAPGVLTVVHSYSQTQYATLMIQIAGTNTGDFSVLNVLGNASLNGFLDPVLLNGFVPAIGQTFTFLDYASLTGEFSHIQHRVFDNGLLQWSVIYDDNHAILSVEQHTPDHGSTFLLLTLGLLGLVTYRHSLTAVLRISRKR
jgi:autotransporter-associated beta strand protein